MTELQSEAGIRTAVVVSFDHEGIHHWPSCPIEEVAFLREKHRHLFRVVASKIVSHDDREVEIIILKRTMQNYLKDKFGKDFGAMSCEMIARDLMEQFNLLNCSVLEDNENGAYLWRTVKPLQ